MFFLFAQLPPVAPLAPHAAHAPHAPIAPAWVVLPLSLLALLVVAGHWIVLGRSDMPRFRKSVRTANGLVMMLAIPILAFGFGVVSPSNGKLFALTWMLASGMLMLVLVLALADLLHTAVLARREHRAVLAQIRATRAILEHRLRMGVPAPAPDEADDRTTIASRSEVAPAGSQGTVASRDQGPNAGGHGGA